jgi:fucose 4-O-acetylase-like acetyltransferase
MKNNRNEAIDIIKGVAVLLVLLGHATQRSFPNYEHNFMMKLITSFHMALFIFVSGYVINLGRSTLDFTWIKSKFQKLIYPYIIWYVIYYFFSNFSFSGLNPYLDYSGGFLEYLKRGFLYPTNGLWFLWVLFFCYLVYFLAKSFLKQYTIVGMLVISAIVQVFTTKYFAINYFVFYFPIFTLGYILGFYREYVSSYINKIGIACFVIYPIMFSQYIWKFESPIFINSLEIDNHIKKLMTLSYLYVTAISAILIVFMIANFIKFKHLKSLLIKYGKLSLEIYVSQGLVLNIGIGTHYLRTAVIFITASILSYLIAVVIKRVKLLDVVLLGNTN